MRENQKRYAWLSDIHLDALQNENALVEFAKTLSTSSVDGFFVTGDISTANDVVCHLSIIEHATQKPVNFVLGNHDYFGSDIATVRKKMNQLCLISSHLKYMSQVSYTQLTPTTALVGHDGWYDALYGDVLSSNFMMADWVHIADFKIHSGGLSFMKTGSLKDKPQLIALARQLAHEATTHVMEGIKAAAKSYKNIVVLTHVPPFVESHFHMGKPGDKNAHPWFTSKMMGDMLRSASLTYPNINFLVLAGHTHGYSNIQITSNMKCCIAAAEYASPKVADIIEV